MENKDSLAPIVVFAFNRLEPLKACVSALLANTEAADSDLIVFVKKDKDEAYQQADIFVFPTYNECFGLVLLEAMQYGLPCISTNEGAISDIVDDGVTGYIVEAHNAGHLAAKVEELIDDKQKRMDMGMNGYRKFQEQFTLDMFEKRMSEVLEQLM